MTEDFAYVDRAQPVVQACVDALQDLGLSREEVVESLVGLSLAAAASVFGPEKAIAMGHNVLRLMARDLNEAQAAAAPVRPN